MPIPENPTWAEIRAGMVAAAEADKAAQVDIADLESEIADRQTVINERRAIQEAAQSELRDWQAALRRKLYGPTADT